MHFSHTPDVLVFNGVMELLVCPFPLGLLEGMVEVEVGLVLLGVGGGEACCHVGEVALVIPPGQASWVRVAFSIKGELAGFFHMVVEGVKERLEGALSTQPIASGVYPSVAWAWRACWWPPVGR